MIDVDIKLKKSQVNQSQESYEYLKATSYKVWRTGHGGFK